MNKYRTLTGLKFVIGSLVGAFAIQGVVAACSGNDSDTKPANAQGVSTCAQWEVVNFSDSAMTAAGEVGSGSQTQTARRPPAGWEPFAYNGTGWYVLRRCVQ